MRSSEVVLRGGPTVPGVVVDWLLDAELRGIRVAVDADDTFRVLQGSAPITDEDRAFLRTHRPHVAAVLRYVRDGVSYRCADGFARACLWHGDAQPGLFGAAS